MVVLLVVTPEEWLVIGLQSVGFDPIRQIRGHETNIERFLAHFGASPETLCAIFSDLQTTQIEAARIAKPSILHFLMTMYWLKTYSSETVMAATFKVDEKTARTQVWKYVSCHPSTQGTEGKCYLTFSPFADTPSHTFRLSCSLYLFY